MDNMGLTSLNGDFVWVEITVIPELPSLIIMPLFMIATLLALQSAKENVLYKGSVRFD